MTKNITVSEFSGNYVGVGIEGNVWFRAFIYAAQNISDSYGKAIMITTEFSVSFLGYRPVIEQTEKTSVENVGRENVYQDIRNYIELRFSTLYNSLTRGEP